MVYIVNDWLSNRYYFKITAKLVIFGELSSLRLTVSANAVLLSLFEESKDKCNLGKMFKKHSLRG